MKTTSTSTPLETGFSASLRALLVWLVPLSLVMLAFRSPIDPDQLFWYLNFHLLVIQSAVLLLAVSLAPLADRPWFANNRRPWLASSASVIALTTGFAGLLTLATSAAARYDPSLQFLQLLSALDIAWVTSALFIGARRRWGHRVAIVAAGALIVACVGSIALYLDAVGFGPNGQWIVDGQKMMTIVIPADTVAAIVAVLVLLSASRQGPTAQRNPQS